MNDLDQLRTTLDHHAADVVDTDVLDRVGAVHHRVRLVRRRRRAAVAGTAALSLAVVAGVALLPRAADTIDPTAPRLVGLDVPPRLESLGYAYDFEQGVEGDGKARVRLAASDTPRLVSWGTSGDDDTVEVTLPSEDAATYTGPDFGDFVWVSPGLAGTVSVSGADEIGLAVYELTDLAPAGVTGSGVTFRESVAGRSLLGAAIGEPGQSELTVPAEAIGDAVAYRPYCVGGPEDAMIHVELAGGGLSIGRCDDQVPFDPGSGGGGTVPTSPGADATARVWVSDGEDGPRVDTEDLQLGIGLYDASSSGLSAAGSDVPDLVEHAGHLYRLDPERLVTTRGGREARATTLPTDRRPVLAVGYADAEMAVLEATDGSGSIQLQGVGGASGVIGLLSGDLAAVARVVSEPEPGDRLAVAIYVRAD